MSADSTAKAPPEKQTLAALLAVLPPIGHPIEWLCTLYGTKIFQNHATPFGDPTGAAQVEDILGSHQDEIQSASAIFGLDAFYWDAAWNKCPVDGSSVAAPPAILKLITVAAALKKPLILGTVPLEDPAKSSLHQLLSTLDKSDANQQKLDLAVPQPDCTAKINETIRTNCLTENNCFILDFFSLVQELNSKGELKVKLPSKDGNGGVLAKEVTLSASELRPDGIHLSPHGARAVATKLMDLLKEQGKSELLCPASK